MKSELLENHSIEKTQKTCILCKKESASQLFIKVCEKFFVVLGFNIRLDIRNPLPAGISVDSFYSMFTPLGTVNISGYFCPECYSASTEKSQATSAYMKKKKLRTILHTIIAVSCILCVILLILFPNRVVLIFPILIGLWVELSFLEKFLEKGDLRKQAMAKIENDFNPKIRFVRSSFLREKITDMFDEVDVSGISLQWWTTHTDFFKPMSRDVTKNNLLFVLENELLNYKDTPTIGFFDNRFWYLTNRTQVGGYNANGLYKTFLESSYHCVYKGFGLSSIMPKSDYIDSQKLLEDKNIDTPLNLISNDGSKMG